MMSPFYQLAVELQDAILLAAFDADFEDYLNFTTTLRSSPYRQPSSYAAACGGIHRLYHRIRRITLTCRDMLVRVLDIASKEEIRLDNAMSGAARSYLPNGRSNAHLAPDERRQLIRYQYCKWIAGKYWRDIDWYWRKEWKEEQDMCAAMGSDPRSRRSECLRLYEWKRSSRSARGVSALVRR